MLLEQDIISRFFKQSSQHKNVRLGIGDDAALITLDQNHELVTSIDTLIEGIHFPINTQAKDIGYKALAISLSDIAAMGAKPETALLSLTIPQADPQWLKAFSSGFFELIQQYQMELIGGDTCHGPLSVTTVVNGSVPYNTALKRCGARAGDHIFVTGILGEATYALHNKNAETACWEQLNRPSPRVEAGLVLRDIASAAIDISDGLAGDLEKLCAASHVGARVEAEKIPRHHASIKEALTGGDDFELCFTVAEKKISLLKTQFAKLDIPYQKIGQITENKVVNFNDAQGNALTLGKKNYEHF